MYLTDVEIAKKVHIVGLNEENIKQVIYLKSTKMGREILKLFQNWYLILKYNIVSSRTLWNLSLELVTTDFVTDFVTNSTDNYILSAHVRRP